MRPTLHPEFRNQGIAGRLVDLADEAARGGSANGLVVIVASDNNNARRLYLRHGYRVTSTGPAIFLMAVRRPRNGS